jgi:hypothetical protein
MAKTSRPPACTLVQSTTPVVVDDEALAEHLITHFDVLWARAAGEQERLLARWEGRDR